MSSIEGAFREPMIKPKGNRGAITDIDISDRPICHKLIIDCLPEVGGGAIGGSIKGNSIAKNPILPGSRIMRKELINKFHEHTSILEFKILNTEPSIIFSGTHIFPGHQTFRAMAGLFPSPKESTTTAINSLDNSFGNI
jgi:hypothetical protein